MNNEKWKHECKKSVTYHSCEEDYILAHALVSVIRTLTWVNTCKIVHVWKVYTVDVTSDEITNTPEGAVINLSNRTHYGLIVVVLLPITCLLLLLTLAIPFLLSY